MSYRIGHGYDVHALVPGRRFVLGGVEIPHPSGPLGHSDGDALLHAVSDALLGAVGLGDLGRHFPDTDASLLGIDSGRILADVVAKVREREWELVNVDASILVQRPRLAPLVERIRNSLASCLGARPEQVNVKARTGELLGPVGRGEAIEVHAVVLLVHAPRY